MKRLIVIDTETTGIDVLKGHRIIEIGAVEIIDRKITGSEYQQYIQPDRNVGESVSVHSITDNFLIGKPRFKKIAEKFLQYIKNSRLIIHNAPFDLGFLNNELKLAGFKKRIEDLCSVIDTLELSRKKNPGMLHNLDALCRRLGVDTSTRVVHGALLDAKILANVYLAMTSGQFELFSDNNVVKQIDSQQDIVKIDGVNTKIMVINANKDEVRAHQQYFKTIGLG